MFVDAPILTLFVFALGVVLWGGLRPRGAWAKSRHASENLRQARDWRESA